MGRLEGYTQGRMNFLGDAASLLVGKKSENKNTFRDKHLEEMTMKWEDSGILQNA